MLEENNGQSISYLYERTQKITEALYRVTDLFSDHEPLKWLLRKEGVEILEAILKIKALRPHERIRQLDLITDHIQRALQVLELASSNSFISETNFQVLKREYRTLVDFMTSKRTEFLPEPLVLTSEEKPKQIESTTKKDNDVKIENKEASKKEARSNGHHIRHSDNGHSKVQNDRYNTIANERKQKILSYIKEKDWVSVGELANLFQGKISEKTVQRDLVGMANAGLLLKEGDKRWRRYKLIG